LIDPSQQPRRVPAVIVRESDDLAGSLSEAVVACPGHPLGGPNSKEGYTVDKLIRHISESVVVILIYQNDLVIRKLLQSQGF
jgi:hypothetical protein